MNDNPDLRVYQLTRELNAARAVGDSAFDQGYAECLRHSRMEIPEEFTSALRYGSAHEHVHMPLLDGHVTIVLARTGHGRADERHEADAWADLERVRLDIRTHVSDGVRFVQRRQLPTSIAAVIWQRQARCAVVTNTATPRPRLRAALRSQRAWIVALIIGWAIVRRVGRGAVHTLAPTATVAAASAAAVTAVATAPPVTSMPGLQERGHAIHRQAQPSPYRLPLADPRSQPDLGEPDQTAPDAEEGTGQTEVPAVEQPKAPAAPPADAPAPIPVPTTADPAPIKDPTPPPATPTPTDSSSTYSGADGGDSPDTEDHSAPAQGCVLDVLDCGPIA